MSDQLIPLLWLQEFQIIRKPTFVKSVASRCNDLSIPGHDANYVAQLIVDGNTEILDDFAPASRQRTKKKVCSIFVYNKEVADAKKFRKQYERQFAKSKSEINR